MQINKIQNQPSFGMNLKFENKIAKKIVNNEFLDFYNNCSIEDKRFFFNKKSFMDTPVRYFQRIFREKTQKIPGEVKILTSEVAKEKVSLYGKYLLSLQYKPPKGNFTYLSNDFSPSSLLPKNVTAGQQPFNSAITSILVDTSIVAENSGLTALGNKMKDLFWELLSK